MRRRFHCRHLVILAVLLATGRLFSGSTYVDPQDPREGLFVDEWATVHMAGAKIGYAHSTMARTGEVISTTVEMKMRLGRADQPVTLSTHQTTRETLDGQPREFTMTLEMATIKTSTSGTISDDKVTLVSSQYGMDQRETIAFPKGAVMTWGLFREGLVRGFKPGTQYTCLVYAPDLSQDAPVKAATTVGDWESLDLDGKSMRGQRVTMVMESPIGPLELVSWVDDSARTLKAQVPVPGLGNIELISTDEGKALADFIPPELFMATAIDANRKIDVDSARIVKYRISPKSPEVEIGRLPSTDMQKVSPATDGALEVIVSRQQHVRSAKGAATDPPPALSDYLDSNLMINTADPQLAELAKRAAGEVEDPYALADALRRFVTDYVANKSLNVGFASASEVCRTREGDCSEHAVILAALGRIKGIPTRVVVGLAYVPSLGGRSNVFGYHMWTQFWIDGTWIDLDAALRETVCSPTRIAFATSSLKRAGLADLSLPLLGKIGGINVEILAVE